MPASVRSDTPSSLWDPRCLPFVVGALALVTLGAFENRATVAILPTVAGHLDGMALFGAAAAAPLISSVVATVAAGLWCDRRGPTPALATGLLVFTFSQLVMGAAPGMTVLLVGRVGTGVAEALLDVALTVLVARVLPRSLRPKMFAAMATAWIVPSLIGPLIAGVLADLVGWRSVFLVAIALTVPAALALRPSLRTLRGADAAEPSTAPPDTRQILVSAAVVSAGLAALTLGGPGLEHSAHSGSTAIVGGVAVGAGLALILIGARRVLPRGTARFAAGLPAVVASQGLRAASFAGAGAFIPLMLTSVHGLGPAAAASSLTITGLSWALGSQVNGTSAVQRRTTVTGRVRASFALICLGILGPAMVAIDRLPVWAGLALWAAAGIGMGVGSPTLTTHLLALAPEDEQGRLTAASMLAATISQSMLIAVAGAAIAIVGTPLPGVVLAGILATAAALALCGAAAASRVEARPTASIR
ncbi:MFS transporter [Mumia sp.]|uniref:MFS transporter n=1 Tax=Mumia sp. TaxID=1965300 RepID=UPI00260C2D9E|nr:MFS transporter [Mumia sp.]MDD9349817.1 MFS transporter [Mumia sp.]